MTKLIVAFPNSANAPKNSTFCGQTECTCLYGPAPRQVAIISLYCINRQVFITETAYVYCAVKTDSLNTIQVNFRL
jgi:hypothetical protein